MTKKRLYNLKDRRVLKEDLLNSTEPRVTLSFYKYFHIDDPEGYRNNLYIAMEQCGVLGRIYISPEGVNAQISLPVAKQASFEEVLKAFGLAGIRLNYAIEDDGKSFYKLIIRTRAKIVADGLGPGEIDFSQRGRHISASEFNAITERSDVLLVDMRNHYESEVGHFENAICPDVETFRESLPVVVSMLKDNKSAPVVMYCTGGIRCEKASAYLRKNGFQEVYQLDGGIIEYARQVERKGLRSKFHGKNFVFDERLGERISEEIIAHCHQCGSPADSHVNCANDACHILFIQCEACKQKYRSCCSEECKEFIALPETAQQRLRKTKKFNGSRLGKGRYKAFRRSSGKQIAG